MPGLMSGLMSGPTAGRTSGRPQQASMLRFTLAQMRLSLPRLIAGGLAIAIGSAFVAATLLAGDVMTTTARNSVSASYARADLVVTDALSDEQLTALRGVAGVASVTGRLVISADVAGARGSTYVTVGSLSPDPRLEPQKLTSGSLPSAGQIALPEKDAERLRVAPGGSVVLTLNKLSTDADDRPVTERVTLGVSGLLSDPAGAFSTTGGMALVPATTAHDWYAYTSGRRIAYSTTLIRVQPGADPLAVRSAATAALDRLGPEARPYPDDGQGLPTVRTLKEEADQSVAELTGDTRMMFAFVLGFAAVALLVAALVIANTFQVLVAQRTQTLALLRCVGAVKQQLRRSVLIEAGIVGLAASAAGVLAGSLLAQVTLLVLRRLDVAAQLPTAIRPTVWVILVPILVGTAVTLVASLSPARAATRVAPLAALRPDAGPRLRERASRFRLGFSLALVVLGVLGLLLGVWAGSRNSIAGLGLGVVGGGLSFVGVVLGTVFWVPRVTGWLGRLVAVGGGAPVRLAAVNSVRNPRRTAATSGALLIGVTLVALMTTGAASARSTLDSTLNANYPVDISVGHDPSYQRGSLTVKQLEALRAVPGVATVAPIRSSLLYARTGSGSDAVSLGVRGIDATDARAVVRNTDAADDLLAGKLVLQEKAVIGDAVLYQSEHAHQPARLQIAPGPDGPWTTVDVAYSLRGSTRLALAPAGLVREVAKSTRTSEAWIALARDSDPETVYEDIGTTLTGLTGASDGSGGDPSLPIVANAVERASYEKAINAILAVVIGLLAVSVIIAVVGVANTLSLSVLERRRESATLRTIGLTRRQLRWMLAMEGMVIAAVGAVAGVLLGVGYGWAGTRAVLGGVAEVQLSIPWLQLGLTVVVAVLAGLLASVLPARGAARTSPVAALATT